MRPILVLAAFAVAALSGPLAAHEAAPVRAITVTGEGRVEAAPDLAILSAGVQTEAAEAAAALAATGAAMANVFAALEAQEVAPVDMQTSRLGVDPVWDDGDGRQPRVRGYSASNVVTIRVRDLDRLGAVIDAVGAAGANRVFGIAFELAEPRAELDAARTRAVEDARARAEILAAAAGVTLGPVLSIRESGGAGPGPMLARAEAAFDMPVAEGVVGLEARVEVVYGIE